MKKLALTLLTSALVFPSFAGDAGIPDKETLSKAYKGKTYSPYADRSFPGLPLWGDSHLHTSMSFDAGAFGNRLGLDAAYQFARGDEVIASTGIPA